MKNLLILLLLIVSTEMSAQTEANSDSTTEHAIIQDKHGDNVCSKDPKITQKQAEEPYVKRRKRYKRKNASPPPLHILLLGFRRLFVF